MNYRSTHLDPLKISVVIIDESEADSSAYIQYLKAESTHTYQITQATTLHKGIQLWKSQHFDLALLNLQLPGGATLDFLQSFQSNKSNGFLGYKVPVIVLIEQGNEQQAANAMQLGAIDYLIKEELTESSFQKSILSAIEYQKLAQQFLKSQQQQQLLTEISLQIRQSLDLSQILQSTVDGLRQLLGCDRAVIYQFQTDWSGIIAVESVAQPKLSIFQQEIFDPCLSTKWHEPYLQGRISCVHDRNDPSLTPCYADLLASIQVRACLVTPILQAEPLFHNQCLWGLLIAHQCHGTRVWTDAEIDLVQQLATQASIALQQATAYTQLQSELKERQRAEAALQQLNQELENRVIQRTTALQQSESRLQEAQQIARLGHWEIDLPTGKITWSPEIFTIFGFDRNQPTPTLAEIFQLFTPADRDRITSPLQHATARGSCYELDLSFTRADGSSGHIFVRGKPIHDGQGQVVRRVGIIMDITDRRRTEMALARYTEEVEDLYNNAPCGYHSLDPQGRLIRVNATELQWLGYSREEMIGQPFINFFTQESRQDFFKNFPVFLERGWVKNLEYEIICKDGSTLPVLISATAVKDAKGTLLYNRATMVDIRDLKAAEKALQASETQFRRLADNVPGVIYRYVLHPDGTDAFTYISPHVRDIYELEPEAVMQDTSCFWARIHPEDIPLVKAEVAISVETQQPFQMEHRLITPKGGVKWIHVVSQPTCQENGDMIWDGVANEITDRRRTEAALARYTEEVEDLYHNAPCGYHSLDPQGRFIRVNETELQWLGYSREEMIGQPFIKFCTDESRQAFFQNFPVFLARGWVKNLEFDLFCKNGSILPVLLSATAVKDPDGTLLCTRSTMVDIRDLKAAEKALQASETQFRHLAENVPGIIYRYVLHSDGTDAFTYMSPHIWDIYGLKPEDVIQDSSRFWAMVYPDDIPLLQAERVLSLERLQPFHVEHRFITPQGEEKWMQLTSQPTRQANGDVVWDGVANEITDRKLAEARLQQTNEELARATRLKDEFLANMSHELRTPLNAILGLTEALQDQILGDLTPRQLKALGTIEKSGRHLLALINDILDLAKISSGKMELLLATVPVKSLCDSSLVFVKQQAFKKQIQLISNIPDTIKTITIDELRIKQVLINLLTNAIKFTPEGGQVTLKAAIEQIPDSEATLEPEGSYNRSILLLQVIDTGIGISPADLAKLFQPFTQVDSSLNRKHMGTGLGLAMVQQIAELHGGWVKVDSQPNQGSCFTVALPYHSPIYPVSPQSTLLESPASCLLPHPAQSTPPLILLAEDNEENIETFIDYLTSRNYRIIVAKNGEAAVHLAKVNPPDIILMDIQMPIMDGLEAIQAIRADRQLDKIPIIALTALAMPGDQERCLQVGASQYLSKPVSLRRLADVIEQTLSS
ncbi:PAS domain-containing protein [Alkalinema pantanalense CENA528]|uniref:PAS domain-containing protein n=1 Tax=Alkalinema pantanalense TaxID=1620705 RepID=UPI003D6E4146